MANKIDVKLILQLHQKGMSQNAISKSRHISKHSIGEVIKISQERGITYDAVKDKSDAEVYGTLNTCHKISQEFVFWRTQRRC